MDRVLDKMLEDEGEEGGRRRKKPRDARARDQKLADLLRAEGVAEDRIRATAQKVKAAIEAKDVNAGTWAVMVEKLASSVGRQNPEIAAQVREIERDDLSFSVISALRETYHRDSVEQDLRDHGMLATELVLWATVRAAENRVTDILAGLEAVAQDKAADADALRRSVADLLKENAPKGGKTASSYGQTARFVAGKNRKRK